MSAPKPELTAELSAVIERRKQRSCWCADCLDDMIREVVEIVARKDAAIAQKEADADVDFEKEHGGDFGVTAAMMRSLRIRNRIIRQWGLKLELERKP